MPFYIERFENLFIMAYNFVTKYGINPIYFFVYNNISEILFGPFYITADLPLLYVTEVRILSYTHVFGIMWLMIYLSIIYLAILYCYKGSKLSHGQQRNFFIGCLGYITLYFLDMFHYAMAIQVINMDYWMVFLAAISSVYSHKKVIKI